MTPDFPELQAGLPNRYTLLKVLGRGGAAVVYLAQERHPDRRVAIKVLTEGLGSMAERERFLREIDVVSNFTHPHIVPVFAAGEADKHLYYVMPYLDGQTLRDRLSEAEPLDMVEVVDITKNIAGALDFAHEHGVVHRDIKPENIMLLRDHAMVTDFGIAHMKLQADDNVITASGVALGTPNYMSPEQASAEPDIDGRSDIYSLGCVVFEMLTGAPPFSGETAQEVLTKHIMEPPPAMNGTEDGEPLPDAVQTVVHRALAKRPAQRPESATGFATELAVVTAPQLSLSVSGERVTMPMDAQPRHRLGSWARAIPVAVAVVALLAWFLSGGSRPTLSSTGIGPRWTDSVAVLMIDNLSGDSSDQRVAVGITEEVIGRLAQIKSLKVISRHSIETVQDRSLTAQQLADTLGVRHLLEGSLRVQGNRGRVSIQHLDRTGAHLGANSYDIDLRDGLAAQNAVADSIVTAFVQEIAPQETAPPSVSLTAGPGHGAFLLGQHHLARRTGPSLTRSIASFQEAIALDPSSAPAYASLASAYALALTYRYNIGMDGYTTAAIAIKLADQAIKLDPGYANGFAARGYIRVMTGAPLRNVSADFDSALALQPNAPNAPSWQARLMAKTGRTEEAIETVLRAVALDPLHAGRRIAVGYLALHLHQYDLAVDASLAALAIEPELMLPRSIAARAMLQSGRAAECLDLDLGPHVALRATCLAEAGRQNEADRVVDALVAELSNTDRPHGRFTDVIPFEDLAGYYAWKGNRDSTLVWLRKAYDLSPTGVELRVLLSGQFDRVRLDPIFDEQLIDIRSEIWSKVVAAGG